MEIYQIRGDSAYFGTNCHDFEDLRLLRSVGRGEAILTDGTPFDLDYYFSDPANEGVITDCPGFPDESTLVLSEYATQRLETELSQAGRLFPTTLTNRGIYRKPVPKVDQPYSLFFCEQRLDAIDHDRIEFLEFEGKPVPWIPSRWAFRPEVLEGVGFFRLVNFRNRLFATDRVMDQVKQHAITGLWVQPLWSSEAGALARFDDMGRIDRINRDAEVAMREDRAAMRAFIGKNR